MPTIDNAFTTTQLVNVSLDLVGENAISDIESNDPLTSKARRGYVTYRDAILRSRPWNCARRRQVLAEIANNSDDFDHAYQLPTDPKCLRVLGIEGCESAIWRVEGRVLYTNVNPVVLMFIGEIDAHEMDACLYEVVATRVASHLAGTIVHDSKLAASLLQQYNFLYENALGVDDAEKSADESYSPIGVDR